MKTSQNGIDLIKEFEGVKLTAYLCSAKVPTIGVGHTKTAKMGMVITSKEADDLLRSDLKEAEEAVNKLVKVDLTQNQFDALVSFVFNLGAGNFKQSTLLRCVNSKQGNAAGSEFLKWNKAGGVVLPGLTRRRAAERDLFLKG